MTEFDSRMPLPDALRVIRDARREEEVVITSMGSAREWMVLNADTPHPLDFILVPSSMGQATSVGLGVALARPDLRVIVCSGDGSLLMNLGTLITISAESPANLVLVVMDNGVYEVTGLQPTPGAATARVDGRNVDLLEIARASGFRSVFRFRDLNHWRAEARPLLDETGPTFVLLEVAPIPGAKPPSAPREAKAPERARRFASAVAGVEVRALFRIRRALSSDAEDISQLIGMYVSTGALLPRSASFVAENAQDFVVAVEGGTGPNAGERIVGCAHLEGYAPSLAELRSLAVHPERKGTGIGRAIAAAVEDLARVRQYRILFAVSNDESFFVRQGFERRDVPELDKERSAVSRYKGVFAKTLA